MLKEEGAKRNHSNMKLPGSWHCHKQFASLPNKQQEHLLFKACLKAVRVYNDSEGLLGFLAPF